MRSGRSTAVIYNPPQSLATSTTGGQAERLDRLDDEMGDAPHREVGVIGQGPAVTSQREDGNDAPVPGGQPVDDPRSTRCGP